MNAIQDHATMDHLKNVVYVRNSLITNNMQCHYSIVLSAGRTVVAEL